MTTRYDAVLERLRDGRWRADLDAGRLYGTDRHGNVREIGSLNSKGYSRTAVEVAGRHVSVYVHRVIWMAAHDRTPDPDLDINHINGDPTDNRLVNLELVPRSENNAHALRTGLRGVTPQVVDEIRRAVAGGAMRADIAERYGIRLDHVTALISGRHWTDATEPPTRVRSATRPLTDVQVRAARSRYAAGERQVDIAESLGVSKYVINMLLKGRTYSNVA